MRVPLSTAVLVLSLAGCCQTRRCPSASAPPSSLETQTRLAETERKLAEALEAIEAQKIILQSLEANQASNIMERPPSGPRAKVLSVGRPDEVVINFGAAHGLKAGWELVVARGWQYVATIRVEEVGNISSRAVVVAGKQKLSIAVGDQVIGPW